MDRLAYFDPAKSLEEKERGNDFFKKGRISSLFFEKKKIQYVWHGLICEISSSLASEVSFGRGYGCKTFIAVNACIWYMLGWGLRKPSLGSFGKC